MKPTYVAIACLSLLGTGVAFAADPPDSSSKSDRQQMMKTCMDQQKAQNSSMSKQDMRKACREQLHMSKAAAPAPAPSDTPPQQSDQMSPTNSPPR